MTADMERSTLGHRIRKARLQHGWSLREAAHKAKVNHQTWANAEAGARVQPDNLAAILEVCGLELLAELPVVVGAGGDLVAAAHLVPDERQATALRFLRLLGRMTDRQVDNAIGIMDLWELQLDAGDSGDGE